MDTLPDDPSAVGATVSFRLKGDPRLRVAPPPSAYERLRMAYARDLATEPRLAEWTLAAIEERLRQEPALAHRQARVHRNRARALLVFLTQPAWPTSTLGDATGLAYTPLYDACRALREVRLLYIRPGGQHGSTTELTPAGEAWLLELVEPGTMG